MNPETTVSNVETHTFFDYTLDKLNNTAVVSTNKLGNINSNIKL